MKSKREYTTPPTQEFPHLHDAAVLLRQKGYSVTDSGFRMAEKAQYISCSGLPEASLHADVIAKLNLRQIRSHIDASGITLYFEGISGPDEMKEAWDLVINHIPPHSI